MTDREFEELARAREWQRRAEEAERRVRELEAFIARMQQPIGGNQVF